MGLKEKLAAWVLIRWLGSEGMEVIAAVIQNVWKGPLSTVIGVAMLTLAGFVTFYCSVDATGGWIDPRCAYYVKGGLWLTGVGHLLAPNFTASIAKKA